MIAIGVGSGIVGSMLGVGGGIIISPSLTMLGFYPTQVASTSLIAVSFTSISSTLAYTRQHRIEFALGIKMASLAVPGAIFGAILSSYISLEYFKGYFAVLLCLAGIYISLRHRIPRTDNNHIRKTVRTLTLYIGSVAAGLVSSLFGIGGGVIFVPLMLIILGLSMTRAGPTSQLVLMITSLVGVFTHITLGHPQYTAAVSLSAGAFLGAQIGAKLSNRVNENILVKILSIFLIIVSTKLVIEVLKL
jgi:uncharacterized membrane protein YfcA